MRDGKTMVPKKRKPASHKTVSATSKRAEPAKLPHPLINPALVVAALGVALAGQLYITDVSDGWLGTILLFSFSAFFFLLLILRTEQVKASALSDWADKITKALFGDQPIQIALVIIAFSLSYLIFGILSTRPGNLSFWDVFVIWVIDILLYAIAFVKIPRVVWKDWYDKYKLDLAIALGVTLIAGILRFIWLGQVPNALSGDEGQIGQLVISAMAGWNQMNMFGTAFGHGRLYIFLMAAVMKLLGQQDIFSLRFTSAVAGTLSVTITYLFGLRFFNRRTGIVAAILLAFSHVHVHFSRLIVTGTIQDVLFTTVIWFFFLDGLDRKSPGRMALSGLIMGIFLHIYMGARLTAALVPVYIIALAALDFKVVRDNWKNILVFAGALVASAVPITQWALSNPQEFNARMNQTGILQNGWLAQQAILTGHSQIYVLLLQLRDAFLSLIYYPTYGFYFTTYPPFDWISSAFFILGLIYALFHLRDKRYLLLLGWISSALVIGGALVVDPSQGFYRILLVLPAVYFLIADSFDKLVRYIELPKFEKQAQIVITSLFVIVICAINFKYYFIDYAFSCKYDDKYAHLASDMGLSLGNLGSSYRAFFLGAPYYRYGVHPSTDFLSNYNKITNVDEPLTAPPTGFNVQPPVVFYSVPERAGELTFVKQLFPDGKEEQISECGYALLDIYHVP